MSLKNNKCFISNGLYFCGLSGETISADVASLFDSANICFANNAGNPLADSEYVGTGTVINFAENGKTVESAVVVLSGDTDGDGVITVTDYLNIKRALLHSAKLDGEYLRAADTDGDGLLTATDYLQIERHFLKEYNLYA